MPILVMLHTGSTFLFSVMVCVIYPGQCAPSIPLCCKRIRDHNYRFGKVFRNLGLILKLKSHENISSNHN